MTSSETVEIASPETGAPASAPARRRRTRKADAVLAESVDLARTAVLEIAEESAIGAGHEVRGEEDRLTTHLFECALPGYRGWNWFATLSRAPRSKAATVCEIGLLPTDDAVVAPDWVPWSERVRPEDSQPEEAETEAPGPRDDAEQVAASTEPASAESPIEASADASAAEGLDQADAAETVPAETDPEA